MAARNLLRAAATCASFALIAIFCSHAHAYCRTSTCSSCPRDATTGCTIGGTPIRWGQASSLYFKMAERLNCIQNQVTTHNRVMIRNKVAAFIIVGGQDNVQGVAGQMLGFFAELGFQFPQFPYIAHSRGWSAEDMENNVRDVRSSKDLHEGAAELVRRS